MSILVNRNSKVITQGITGRREQAEAIYHWVSREIRYVAIAMGTVRRKAPRLVSKRSASMVRSSINHFPPRFVVGCHNLRPGSDMEMTAAFRPRQKPIDRPLTGGTY